MVQQPSRNVSCSSGRACDKDYYDNRSQHTCWVIKSDSVESAVSEHVLSRLDFSELAGDVIKTLEVDTAEYESSEGLRQTSLVKLQGEIDNLAASLAYLSGGQAVRAVEKQIEERLRTIKHLQRQPTAQRGVTSVQLETIRTFLGNLRPYWDRL